MIDRPKLDKNIDGKTFREFYYLKEELVDFCRKYGLPTTKARALTRLLSVGNIKNSCRDIIVMKKATLMYWKNNLLHFKQ